MYTLNNLDIDIFLKEYWQQKPLVIKNGFRDFYDPVDEHELAGLTEEESVDSRIVSFNKNQWQVTHGPYEDINQHCVGAWSLLVQSVDHYIPEADELMRAFDFIPHWRMDDLMVSYSNAEAGVGPHLDQYDVFIIQGKGTRRWQVGLPSDFTKITPHADLSQISGFEPAIDQVLSAGDVLYIPANHPHNGVALEECLNYSVGFRAPSQQEMMSSFADYAIDQNILNNRYQDQALSKRKFSGEIKQQEIANFQQLLHNALQTDHFSNWLVNYMSQSKVLAETHDSEENYTDNEISLLLKEGNCFVRAPGIKPVFIQQDLNRLSTFEFFIEGQKFSVPSKHADFVKNFLYSANFVDSSENNLHECLFFTQLLSTLVNSGYWYLD
ncbi:cupin domain-containing protein [Paraglaciecola sp.]|uniref:cupin domain-containing protein n=1 Tax=Paraglaciecola sp. TaxID=1920173 RepID=UPI003EF7AC92